MAGWLCAAFSSLRSCALLEGVVLGHVRDELLDLGALDVDARRRGRAPRTDSAAQRARACET